MKKLLLAALIVVAAASSAFALDVTNVNFKVKSSFEAKFSGAQSVTWSAKDAYLKATFTIADERVEAFFGTDGELIGLSRQVDLKKLPLNAIQTIQKKYGNYKVTETIEFDQDGEKAYYVSLADGNKKQILEVSLYGSVSVFKGGNK